MFVFNVEVLVNLDKGSFDTTFATLKTITSYMTHFIKMFVIYPKGK